MTAPTWGLFHTGTVCGIKTVWTEPSTPAGDDITGCMCFRVGIADETLPVRGITHLIEHLSMFSQPMDIPHMNAAVSLTKTDFRLRSSPSHVKQFLQDVSHAIHHLPEHRLKLEKRVLSAESANRTLPTTFNMLRERFGLTTFGLGAVHELGVPAITTEQLRWWASRYFTRENCVLVFDGRPPTDLKIHLPSGEFIPAPPSSSTVHNHFPRHCLANSPQVGFQGVMPNSPVVHRITEIVHGRLKKDALAHGKSYRNADYSLAHCGDGHTLISFTALVKQESSLDGTRDFQRSLQDIACVSSTPRPVTDDELGEYHKALQKEVQKIGSSLSEGMTAAAFLLSGQRAVSATEILTASAALTPSVVTDNLRQLFDEAVTLGPDKPVDSSSSFYVPQVEQPLPSDCLIYPRIDDPSVTLVIGDTGLFLTNMGESDAPAYWDDIVAVGVFPRPDLLIMTRHDRSALIRTADYEYSKHLHHTLVQKLPMHLTVYQGT